MQDPDGLNLRYYQIEAIQAAEKAIAEHKQIALLARNTVFSKLQLDKMKEFRDVFNDPALADFVGNGGITTTIEAPVIMIIPIAIYV